jgi:ATP-binding cassette subfamily G (WHITE) protein 2
MKVTGDVHINGSAYNKNLLKSMSGYVMQDDVIHAQLTVQETLMYTAALRMPSQTTLEERQDRCTECLKTMGIEYCRDVIVGDSRNKGISGGERKRLCVAMELMTKPKLLFLDEPTSGLDSTTALSLMHTMKSLCESGQCTVVCTIHQPQTKIFNLMDNLLLMKKGEIVYQGK